MRENFIILESVDSTNEYLIEHGRDFSIPDFVDALVRRLDELRADITSQTYLEEYRRLYITVGREITYTKDQILHKCKALGIDEKFGLITEDGVLKSGEVSVLFRSNAILTGFTLPPNVQ